MKWFILGLIIGYFCRPRIFIPDDYGVEPADTTMKTWYDVTYRKADYGYLMEVHYYKDGNDSRETVVHQYVYRYFPWERGFWRG